MDEECEWRVRGKQLAETVGAARAAECGAEERMRGGESAECEQEDQARVRTIIRFLRVLGLYTLHSTVDEYSYNLGKERNRSC